MNAVLLFTTHKLIPDPSVLPIAAPRKAIDMSSSAAMGITPFVLAAPEQTHPPPDTLVHQPGVEDEFKPVPLTPADRRTPGKRDSDAFSVQSYESADSQAPLR